ncbi:MAG: hypothetical protein Q8S58_04400 [Bosea sp. (in: a-proteobacteria)]|nr:hypothetical protein [Bosea sp. (in: a-proteobacteria)]
MLQPARLKSRSGAEGGGERPVEPPRPGLRRRPSRVGRFGRIMVLLLALGGTGWAGVATWLLYREKAVVAALQQEQQVLQASYDERMRVLTRRLVSSIATQRAPGAAPREGGADDQLADLIARQIELEARQNLLGTLTGQAVAPVLPNSGAQAPGGPGGLAAVDPFQGNILERINPAVVAPQKRLAAVALRAEEAMPLSERVALLQQSLDRIDQAQGQQVSALGLRLSAAEQEALEAFMAEAAVA